MVAVIRRQAVEPVAFGPGRRRYQTHTDSMTMVVFQFQKQPGESRIPPHSHPHEQISYVARGTLRYLIGGEWSRLEEGDMATIPPNVEHTVELLSPEVTLVDAFHPVREDFLD